MYMLKRILIFLIAFLLPFSVSASILGVQQGGTGSSTLTGIIIGNGINPVNTLTLGTNLSLSGTTLNASGGGGGGSGTVSTSSAETATNIPWWTSTSGTPAQLSGGSSSFQWLNPGLLDLASTTIGNGTQTGGLTVSGGATTTGSAYFATKVQINSTTTNDTVDIGGAFPYVRVMDTSNTADSATVGVYNNQGNGGFFRAYGTTFSVPSLANTAAFGPDGLTTQIVVFSNSGAASGGTGTISLRGGGYTSAAEDLLLDKGGSYFTHNNVGIGTTTPWGFLSIAAQASGSQNPLFVVASSTPSATTTAFIINASNNVGIGTANPLALLQVSGNAGSLYVGDSTNANSYVNFNGRAFVGLDANNNRVALQGVSTKGVEFIVNQNTFGAAGGIAMVINTNGNTGVGTTTPWGLLSVAAAAAGNQSPLFVVASSTPTATTTPFIINAAGNVGVSSSTPMLFSVGNVAGFASLTSATSSIWSSLVIATSSSNAFVVQDQYGTQDLVMSTASSTSNNPIFVIQATSSTATLFQVDQYGHIMASSTGATPAISSCGTGSPVMGANANDDVGSFTTGTSASSCTITFGSAYSATPVVVISDSNTTAVVDVSAVSTTGFTISLASALSAVTVYYMIEMP